jgi:Tol biopolymer transport system component
MSPEQAEGKTVDHRTDIFSIGIILFEMITGEHPFKGDSTASILSSILRDKPVSVTELNPDVPRDLSKIIRHCLVKDPEDRYQTAKDLRYELKELKQEVESGEVMEGLRAAAPRSKWLVPVALAVAAVVAGTVVYLSRPVEEVEAPTETLGGTLTRLTFQTGEKRFPSLSPDGDDFVYDSVASGNWDIYSQRVGGETAFNLTEDSAAHDCSPAFSPDGKQIVFRSEREGGGLFVMGATGESVRRLTDFGYNPAWSPDGEEIVFATQGVDYTSRTIRSKLWIVNVASGEKRLLTESDAVQPNWSPHGHRIAFWSMDDASGTTTGQRDLWTLPAAGGEAVPVTNDVPVDWNPVWSPDGRYLYFSSDRGGSMNLWRVQIEEESGKALGQPEAVTTGGFTSRQHISFSADGKRVAYQEQLRDGNIWKVALNPAYGNVDGEPVQITKSSRPLRNPALSPDGNWLAYVTDYGEQKDLFIMRTDGTGHRQLTDDLHWEFEPQWSPDGEKIAFPSNRSGAWEIWTIHPDGSGLRQLTDAKEDAGYPAWSPDGSGMTYHNDIEGLSYIFDPKKPWKEQTPLSLPPFSEGQEQFRARRWSPDGRWLAGEIVRAEGSWDGIVVYSLKSQEYRRLTDTGTRPEWLPDSRRLLFLNESGGISLVDVQSKEVQEVLSVHPDRTGYRAVSADGRWIYFNRFSLETDIWMLTLN